MFQVPNFQFIAAQKNLSSKANTHWLVLEKHLLVFPEQLSQQKEKGRTEYSSSDLLLFFVASVTSLSWAVLCTYSKIAQLIFCGRKMNIKTELPVLSLRVLASKSLLVVLGCLNRRKGITNEQVPYSDSKTK